MEASATKGNKNSLLLFLNETSLFLASLANVANEEQLLLSLVLYCVLFLFSGFLSHLSLLKVKARSLKSRKQQQQPNHELKVKVDALRTRRNQLRAEIQAHKVKKNFI